MAVDRHVIRRLTGPARVVVEERGGDADECGGILRLPQVPGGWVASGCSAQIQQLFHRHPRGVQNLPKRTRPDLLVIGHDDAGMRAVTPQNDLAVL